MPRYYKMTTKYPYTFAATHTNGINYALKRLYPDGAYSSAALWRKDWLENVGIDKIPETIDEFEEAFKRFVYNDPDKNGADDTIGLTAGKNTLGVQAFAEIFGAYGNQYWVWHLKDGVVKAGCTAPEAKEALAKLADWYKKGLIDKEFMTREDFLGFGLAKANNVGYTSVRWYAAWSGNPAGSWAKQIEDSVEGAETSIGPLPLGPKGRASYRFGIYNNHIFFGKQLDSDQPKKEKLLQILDATTMDWDTAVRTNWGVKGKHWDYADKSVGKDSGMKILEPYNDAQQRANEGLEVSPFRHGAWSVLADVSFSTRAASKEFQELASKYSDVPEYPDDILEGVQVGVLDPTLSNDLGEIRTKAYIEIITGAKPVSYFDTFVKEWWAAGGEQLTRDAQVGYESIKTYLESIK